MPSIPGLSSVSNRRGKVDPGDGGGETPFRPKKFFRTKNCLVTNNYLTRTGPGLKTWALFLRLELFWPGSLFSKTGLLLYKQKSRPSPQNTGPVGLRLLVYLENARA
jgi:hypothetical protein